MGTTLASGTNYIFSGELAGVVLLWDVNTGQLKATLERQASGTYSVSFSPDGNILASGSDDKTILLWDVFACPHSLSGRFRWRPQC